MSDILLIALALFGGIAGGTVGALISNRICYGRWL